MASFRSRPTLARPPAACVNSTDVGLFAHLNDVCYFAKNLQRRFTAANQALVNMLCLRDERDLLGKTDHELIPSYLADAYLEDDLAVINDGVDIINKVELVTHNDFAVYWYTTTKIPRRDATGNIIGLEGMTRKFQPASSEMGPYPELYRVIDFIGERYAEKLKIGQMAEVASMTVRSFERRFNDRFHIGPIAYLKKVRINAACQELIQTNHVLADIAQLCGFCDQSYMTKEFARLMKTTPQAYRNAHTPISARGSRRA